MIRKALAISLLILSGSTATAAPAGVWSTPENKAKVRIAACGGGLCATILALQDPNDGFGKPKVDIHNADAAKRGRSIVGLVLLNGMVPEGDRWVGYIYNPEDGRTYKAYMTLDGDNRLKIQGCALGRLICKTQVWSRAP